MNLGIKDGSRWRQYHKHLPHEGWPKMCFWTIGWISVVLIWNLNWTPWLSPVFIVWGLLGFLWMIRAILSRGCAEQEEKRIREQTYYH